MGAEGAAPRRAGAERDVGEQRQRRRSNAFDPVIDIDYDAVAEADDEAVAVAIEAARCINHCRFEAVVVADYVSEAARGERTHQQMSLRIDQSEAESPVWDPFQTETPDERFGAMNGFEDLAS